MKFQGALPQYTGRHCTRFSAVFVGQAPTTVRNNNQPIAAVQCNSDVSAYAHMSSSFNYNKISMASMGLSVQVHEKTDKRGTWAYHTVEGLYLVTSPEHYLTHRCHIKSTNSKRFTDTIDFNHKKLTRPTITHADKVMAAIADFSKAIKNLGNDNGGK